MSETSCEMITRALHARDPSAMVFAGHAVMALDELRDTLAARESELAEAQQRLNEVANAQYNACTTECIDGIWWAKGSGIVAGPQATEQDVLLEVAENWWRVAAEAQRRVAELEEDNNKAWGAYNRLQDERAEDFAKWFKIIGFGGLTEYQAECPQVIDLALRELASWRWLADMFCTVQAMASTIPDDPYWVVLDVDGEALGEGDTAVEAIEDACKNFRPADRITHIPGKEDDDGEMH